MTAMEMRPVDPTHDAPLLHAWVSAERAEFWGMRGATVDEVSAIYRYIQDQPHLAAYLVEVEGAERPLALVQTYDPVVDEIGGFYERQPGDLGMHALLPDDPARAGRTPEIVAFVVGTLLSREGVRRLVLEPDVANEKSLAFAERLGAERGPRTRVVTPYMDKVAQFFFLTPSSGSSTT